MSCGDSFAVPPLPGWPDVYDYRLLEIHNPERNDAGRTQLLRSTANLRGCLIGMEAAEELIFSAAHCGNKAVMFA